MNDQPELNERVRQVKSAHQERLMGMANVIGVGIGYVVRGHESDSQLAIIVLVTKKVPRDILADKDLIPSELEGIPVDVQEVGELRAVT